MEGPSPWRDPAALPPPDMGPQCTAPPPAWPTPRPCSHLFNLDLIVLGPSPPDMIKLVHYEHVRLAIGQFASYWNAFLFYFCLQLNCYLLSTLDMCWEYSNEN